MSATDEIEQVLAQLPQDAQQAVLRYAQAVANALASRGEGAPLLPVGKPGVALMRWAQSLAPDEANRLADAWEAGAQMGEESISDLNDLSE